MAVGGVALALEDAHASLLLIAEARDILLACVEVAVELAVVGDQRRLVKHDRDAPEHRKVALDLGEAALIVTRPEFRSEGLLDQAVIDNGKAIAVAQAQCAEDAALRVDRLGIARPNRA